MTACDHDWYWMAEDYQPNDDGETTTKYDYFGCRECGETKVETEQLNFVKRFARSGSNPLAIPRK